VQADGTGTESRDSLGVRRECAYLVLSHKNPWQVEALAQRILGLSPTAHVVIHHDLKGGPPPWDGHPPARVHFVERTSVAWGSWSIVEATLRMIRFAREQLDSEWLVVVSGEHWPVTDLAAWEAAMLESRSDAFMPAERLPTRLRFGKGNPDLTRDLARCRLRWFTIPRPRWRPLDRGLAALSKLSSLTHPLCKLEYSVRNDAWFVGLPRRRGPLAGWDLYKGSEWFACNRRSVDVILRADERVTSWFRQSHIPDESYFQSLLHHDGGVAIDGAVVTWVPPQPPTPTAGWMLLKERELPQVASSTAAFARKLDPERNPEVMAAIDQLVDAGRSQPEVRSR
jgi:hypothetical protein